MMLVASCSSGFGQVVGWPIFQVDALTKLTFDAALNIKQYIDGLHASLGTTRTWSGASELAQEWAKSMPEKK